MPTIRIPPGVVRAETKAMVPGRWSNASLIRWHDGVMIPVGGNERLTGTPLGSIPRGIHVWLDDEQMRHAAVLCDDKIFRNNENPGQTDFVPITPVGFLDANVVQSKGYGSGRYGVGNYGSDAETRGEDESIVIGGFNPTLQVRYSMGNWNNELLALSSADGRIYVYDPRTPNVLPHVAENVPTFLQDFIVTDEHHLMVFAADGYPNRVAWSDQGNRSGWNYANVTGQAGFFDLEGAGKIVSARKIPGAILVFTSTSVWLGRYIGAPYYYAFSNIAEGCTPISAQSIAVAGSRVFWMGAHGFWKFEGGIVSPLPHTLGTGLFEDIDQVAPRRACAGYNGLFPEIWFFYPSKQGLAPLFTENDRYVIFNFDPGREWWADGVMERSVYTSSPIDNYPLAGSDQTHIYRHETGFTNEGVTRAGLVEATVGSLSFGDGDAVYSVHQCQIDNATGPQAVEFDFMGTVVRGGPEKPLQTGLKPKPSGLLATHFSARDFSMTVRGVEDNGWGLGAMIFDKVKRRGR